MSDRPVKEYAEYPEPPRFPNGESMGLDWNVLDGGWRVVQNRDLVAVYSSIYFWSLDEVLLDLLPRLQSEDLQGKCGPDAAVWKAGRIQAAIHEPMVGRGLKVVRFIEKGNDPGGAAAWNLPGWPTRDQWIASGRGALWFDKDNPENPAS